MEGIQQQMEKTQQRKGTQKESMQDPIEEILY